MNGEDDKPDQRKTLGAAAEAIDQTKEKSELKTAVAAATPKQSSVRVASHSSQPTVSPAPTVSTPKTSSSSIEISSRQATSSQDSKRASVAAPTASRNIEDQPYYHRDCSRQYAAAVIQKPGDFIVRETPDFPGQCDIVISAMDDYGKIWHITLGFDPNTSGWYIGRRKKHQVPKYTFATVVPLIDHYRKKGLSRSLKLETAVPRPDWMIWINPAWIDFDEPPATRSHTSHAVHQFCRDCWLGLERRMRGEIGDDVRKGELKMPGRDGQLVAIKRSPDDRPSYDFISEIQLIASLGLNHANVIKFVGYSFSRDVLMLTEYCIGGTLHDHLIKHGAVTEEKEKLLYCYELSEGLKYLHSKNCVGATLSDTTCLISGQGRLKISEFGLARQFGFEEDKHHTTSMGSDICEMGSFHSQIFGKRVSPASDPGDLRAGARPSLPTSMPPSLAALIYRMWAPSDKPDMRIVAGEIYDMIKTTNLSPEAMTINKLPGVRRERYLFDPVEEVKHDVVQPSRASEASVLSGRH